MTYAQKEQNWRGYLIAVVATAVATALRWPLDYWLKDTAQYAVFYVSVAVSAALAGWKPGIVASVLGLASGFFCFIYLPGRFQPDSPQDYVQLGLCVLIFGLITALGEWGHRRQKTTQQMLAEMQENQRWLRHERDLNSAVLNTAGALVVLLDRQGRIVRFNRACEVLTGYSEKEALGRIVWEFLIPPEELPGVRQTWDALQAKNFPNQYQNHWLRRDGSQRLISWSNTALLAPDGEVQTIIAIGLDITERKRAEDALLSVRDRLAAELEAMNRLHELSTRFLQQEDLHALLEGVVETAIASLGAQMGHVHLLDRATGELPIAAQRGLEESFLDYFSHIKPGQLACGTAIQSAQRVVVEDVTQSPLFLADASAMELKLAARIRAMVCTPLVAHAGQAVGVLSIDFHAPHRPSDRDLRFLDLLARMAADFIERKQAEEALRQSEQQFRTLAEVVPQMVWRTAPEGRVDYVNARWCDYTGQTAEEAHGYGWANAIHPEDRPLAGERWATATRAGDIYETEYRLRGKSGEYRWFLARGLPLRDSEGQITRWFGTSTDVHEQKMNLQALVEAQEALQKAKDELAQANGELERKVEERTAKMKETMEELEHFSYTITHDMRAPLRAMQGFGHLLLGQCEDCLDPQRREFLRKIAESASRMDALITDALNYTKIVRKDFPLEPVHTDKLLRSMVESYPQFQPPKAEISIKGTLPVVLANEAGLTQCFSNLLGNAIKFVKPGQVPKVRVWAEKRGEYVRLWFEDNGIGIAKRHQEQIFVMFQRLSRDYEGTGIGLALVSKAAERMQGKVGVESEEGQGSRFWIELKSAESNTPTYAREAAAVHRG